MASTSEDHSLLAGIASGDVSAFAAAYDLYAPALHGSLLARGLSTSTVERVLFTAFMSLWMIAPRLRSGESAQQHLYRLTDFHRTMQRDEPAA